MQKLSTVNYQNICALFPEHYPNLAFIYGIIEGRLSGEIYADREDAPQSCLVMLNKHIWGYEHSMQVALYFQNILTLIGLSAMEARISDFLIKVLIVIHF